MHQRHNSRGFTLVELMFAMGFVAVLMVIVLTATIQITRIYNKGITLKEVNQAGLSIGDELTSALKQGQGPLNLTALSHQRLCLGQYSYVWNLDGSTENKYTTDSTPIGLVKVIDSGEGMCSLANGNYPLVPNDSAAELLLVKSSDVNTINLVLKNLTVVKTAASGTNYLYDTTYTVATNDDSLLSGGVCSGGSGDEFCALNTFEFTVGVKGD